MNWFVRAVLMTYVELSIDSTTFLQYNGCGEPVGSIVPPIWGM